MSPPALPLARLDALERAALALIEAVRGLRGDVSHSTASLSHAPARSVVEVCNEFLLAKAKANRSPNYIRVTLAQLKNFCADTPNRPLAAESAASVETWLYSHDWQPVTVRNHLGTVRTLFEFAVARGYLVGNPANGIDAPTVDVEPPAIHTPEEVRAVLETARAQDVDVCRWLAVRYFAGLRASEASSLSEESIRGERRFIEVTAAKAKTRRRRLVTIEPALAAWLEIGGKLPLGDVNTKMRRLTKALPFEFPRNATRHSFVSYHLAAFGSAAKTALEAGHTEQILFNHYREIVTPEQAREFWSITPR